MNILAIDPGSEQSAFIYYDPSRRLITSKGIVSNRSMINVLSSISGVDTELLVIEYVQPRGEMLYTQLVDTIFWSGRFIQVWDREWAGISRQDIKHHLCGNRGARDSNVRAALISRFSGHKSLGAGRHPEIGMKASPGPLYGVVKDMWAALAVAVVWAEQEADKQHYRDIGI